MEVSAGIIKALQLTNRCGNIRVFDSGFTRVISQTFRRTSPIFTIIESKHYVPEAVTSETTVWVEFW